jgi:hypothetical protein
MNAFRLYELTESNESDTEDSKVSPTIDFHFANNSSFLMGVPCCKDDDDDDERIADIGTVNVYRVMPQDAQT